MISTANASRLSPVDWIHLGARAQHTLQEGFTHCKHVSTWDHLLQDCLIVTWQIPWQACAQSRIGCLHLLALSTAMYHRSPMLLRV